MTEISLIEVAVVPIDSREKRVAPPHLWRGEISIPKTAEIRYFSIRGGETENPFTGEIDRIFIFFPGLGISSQEINNKWDFYYLLVMSLLAKKIPNALLVTLDPPGWGGSNILGKPEEVLSPRGKATIIKETTNNILNRVGGKPEICFIGHSSGGLAVAWSAWEEAFPKATYILDAPSGVGFDRLMTRTSALTARLHPRLFDSLNRAGQNYALNAFGCYDEYTRMVVQQLINNPENHRIEATEETKAQLPLNLIRERMRIVGGENDRLVNTCGMGAILIPGAGHFAARTHPAQWIEASGISGN